MYYLVTYDISREDNGEKRLQKVAKVLQNYGIRVQNSVFEISLQNNDLMKLKDELKNLIGQKDSVRIYKLAKNSANCVEIIGDREQFEIFTDATFIL